MSGIEACLLQGSRAQVISDDTTTGLIHAEAHRQAPRLTAARAVKLGCVCLLCCAAALLTGCSNDPLRPGEALWTGTTKAQAATPAAPSNDSRKGAYRAGARGAGGWGPYSGRRGQETPPDLQNYAFKGDPNANDTFAPGPGQVQ
jgi:hypothetical protein